MIAAVRLFAQTVRTVGHHDFFYSQSLDAFEPPEILTGTQTCFFLERESGNYIFNIHILPLVRAR